ncbi:MAG: DNA-binding transcriptional regulator [Pirellulales bacterium]|nr:DNA-binding transcriptional regulator [Pirellulales bacterium]
MRKRCKVALLIETSRAYGRGLLRGISAYTHTHRPWSVYFEPHGIEAPPPLWLRKWKGDGILARITEPATEKLILATGLPAIDLRGAVPDSQIPLVGLNSQVAARMAFAHLRERGFHHFAFCGVATGQYRFLDLRAHELERIVQENGFSFSNYPRDTTAKVAKSWDEEQYRIAQWVIQLPKPVGIMACHDDQGHTLLNACRDCQINVPDDVAVVGVDNDEVLCELSDPPLSSVHSNTVHIGYRAAALLDQMMAGEISLSGTSTIDPLCVVARRSTDTLAVNDREMAAAMRFIREHACDGINVQDVLQHTGLSRSTLDRRFSSVFGKSAREEISRLRLERVKSLLINTDHPLPKIAELAGFEHSEHMGTLFRHTIGETPGEYRKANQVRHPFLD